MIETKTTERVILERETEKVWIPYPPDRYTDAGAALSAGLAAGTLRMEGGRVVCASGHPARWKEAAGQWGPDYGELGALERQGLDIVGG